MTTFKKDEFYAAWQSMVNVRRVMRDLDVSANAHEVRLDGVCYANQPEPYMIATAELSKLLKGTSIENKTLEDILKVAAFIINNGQAFHALEKMYQANGTLP